VAGRISVISICFCSILHVHIYLSQYTLTAMHLHHLVLLQNAIVLFICLSTHSHVGSTPCTSANESSHIPLPLSYSSVPCKSLATSSPYTSSINAKIRSNPAVTYHTLVPSPARQNWKDNSPHYYSKYSHQQPTSPDSSTPPPSSNLSHYPTPSYSSSPVSHPTHPHALRCRHPYISKSNISRSDTFCARIRFAR
jgi:hypothetical protein